jgi:hypothetical protein
VETEEIVEVEKGKACLYTSNGYTNQIEEAFFLSRLNTYPTKLSGKIGFMWKHIMKTMRSSSSLPKILDMANRHLKRCNLSRLDCTTHTSNPYHILHTK